jgi:hypothetical protein
MEPKLEQDEPLAPDYPFRGVHRGLQGVTNEDLGRFPTCFLEFEAVPEEFIDAGDRVIVLGEFQGREKSAVNLFGHSLYPLPPSMTTIESVSRIIQMPAP